MSKRCRDKHPNAGHDANPQCDEDACPVRATDLLNWSGRVGLGALVASAVRRALAQPSWSWYEPDQFAGLPVIWCP